MENFYFFPVYSLSLYATPAKKTYAYQLLKPKIRVPFLYVMLVISVSS